MAARRPTLATVAERVGVTAMTVSNAYNRPDKLSADLRERILDAARDLGYPGPHPVARSLRHGRTRSVGVLLGETLSYGFDDPGAVAFLGGVADECTAAGHNLLLLATGSEDASVVRGAAVDGFILWSIPRGHPLLPAVLDRGLPLVMHGGPRVPGVRHVHIDNRPAAGEVARHAVAGGRRPAVISFKQRLPRRDRLRVGIPSHGVAYQVSADRLAGYADGIAAAGLDPARVPVFEVSVNDRTHGRAAAAALLDQRPRPTAILAMSDELALGALAELSDRGLTVPGDVALTGWDDTAGSRTAGLTTVRQSLRDQGAACARLLLTPDADVPAPAWELVVRDSTG
jgi:DNA-binding LacI/PurR family transcriptional regulator